MNPEITAAIVAGISAITAALIAGIRTIFKKIEAYLVELKPNGGNSLKDQVTRLEKRQKEVISDSELISKKVDTLSDKLDMLSEAFKAYIQGR